MGCFIELPISSDYLENFFGNALFFFFFLFQLAFFRCGNFRFLIDHVVENGFPLVDNALGGDDWVFADLKAQIATVEIANLKIFCFISPALNS